MDCTVALFLREGCTLFSLTDVQEIDAIISGFNAFETKEAGPLILTWAVFLCLISSLPGKQENSVLMVCGFLFPILDCIKNINMFFIFCFNFVFQDIDHVGYVRQAFEAASLSYFLELLQSDILKDSDVSYSQLIVLNFCGDWLIVLFIYLFCLRFGLCFCSC